MTDEVASAPPRGPVPGFGEQLAQVLGRVSQGSETAFAELYDLTRARVYGLVVQIVRAPDLAAEITQEVYVDVWRHAARWSGDKGSVLAWVYTIAHRRAVDCVRSVQKQTERDDRWAVISREDEPDETWENVERNLEVAGVRSALDELTPLQKEAVSLTYYGGYSQRELAELLGLPLGTVKSRVRDGLMGLRNVMGDRT